MWTNSIGGWLLWRRWSGYVIVNDCKIILHSPGMWHCDVEQLYSVQPLAGAVTDYGKKKLTEEKTNILIKDEVCQGGSKAEAPPCFPHCYALHHLFGNQVISSDFATMLMRKHLCIKFLSSIVVFQGADVYEKRKRIVSSPRTKDRVRILHPTSSEWWTWRRRRRGQV